LSFDGMCAVWNDAMFLLYTGTDVSRDKAPLYALYMLNRQNVRNVTIPLVPGEMKVTVADIKMLQVARRKHSGYQAGTHTGQDTGEKHADVDRTETWGMV
jgi:hypothetical protein